MSIKKSIFKIFNGSGWDEYYHKTSSDQVVHTKADGTETTVQEELSTLKNIKYATSPTFDLNQNENKVVSVSYTCPKAPETVIPVPDGGAPFSCSVNTWNEKGATIGVLSATNLTGRRVRLIIIY